MFCKSEAARNLWKAIGPGILVACAAVGGSHLVWSTQAGAIYGWQLAGLILMANLFKFPFFLYGQSYTAASGESLLDGYRRLGKAYIYVFLLINILTGVINIAGVAVLSGALLSGFEIFPGTFTDQALALLCICVLLLIMGHYRLLDSMAKVVIVVLTFTTLAAVILAIRQGPQTLPEFKAPSPWKWTAFPFLVFLFGWMPAPIDLSAWSSLWIFSRRKQTGHFATTRETKIDFYLGYAMAVILAMAFVALGSLVMHGTGEELATSSIGFTKQLIGLYAATIGSWSRPLILTAAFVTMFSTTLTCVDGYPRSLAACCKILYPKLHFSKTYTLWILLTVCGSVISVSFFTRSLLQHLQFAAAVSFLTSPILAIVNFRVMFLASVPPDKRPGWFLKLLSLAGLVFFFGMSAGYIFVQFIKN
ncbi:MAG: NRAMP family divalent metal transporter [Kiritimatiellia bacterium]